MTMQANIAHDLKHRHDGMHESVREMNCNHILQVTKRLDTVTHCPLSDKNDFSQLYLKRIWATLDL